MTLSENETAVREYHALGFTDRQIREAVGIAKTTVSDIRKRLGLAPNRSSYKPAPPPPPKRLDREYLAREFDESMKALQSHGDHAGVRRQIKRVASELNVNYDHLINVYSHQMGLVVRQPVRRYTDEQYAEADRLLGFGMSYTEVGKIVGIDRKMIAQKIPGKGLTASEAQTVRWVNERMTKMGI